MEVEKALTLSREGKHFDYTAVIGSIKGDKKYIYAHKKVLISALKEYFPNIKSEIKEAETVRDYFFEDILRIAKRIRKEAKSVSHLFIREDILEVQFKVGKKAYFLIVETTNQDSVQATLWQGNELLIEIYPDYYVEHNDKAVIPKFIEELMLDVEEIVYKYSYVGVDNEEDRKTAVKPKAKPEIVEFWI